MGDQKIYGHEIVVNEFSFVSGGKKFEGDSQGNVSPKKEATPKQNETPKKTFTIDDIPF